MNVLQHAGQFHQVERHISHAIPECLIGVRHCRVGPDDRAVQAQTERLAPIEVDAYGVGGAECHILRIVAAQPPADALISHWHRDERVKRIRSQQPAYHGDLVVTDEISIGDYVLTGGELPAMIMIDAVARHIPGVLGAQWAADEDSHASGLLEYAQYTRPPTFRGLDVPAPLLSGDHAGIARWRREDAIRRTWARRPDLLLTAELTEVEKYSLAIHAEKWIEEGAAQWRKAR